MVHALRIDLPGALGSSASIFVLQKMMSSRKVPSLDYGTK
jgi:hypothetical protein